MSTYQRFTLALMLTLKEEEIRQSLDKLHWTTNAGGWSFTTNVLAKSWLERRVGLQQNERARERERDA